MDPRRLLPALAAAAALCAVVTLVVGLSRGRPTAADDVRAQPSALTGIRAPGPAAILSGWDEQRSTAWSEGDPGALRALYADGSRAGAADVRLLRRYADRGLRVTGLRTQVLSLDVLDRADDRLRLVVTDRIVGGRASGGGETARLPADRASTRQVELVRVGEEWLVAEVRDQRSADASTSLTSSSSKS